MAAGSGRLMLVSHACTDLKYAAWSDDLSRNQFSPPRMANAEPACICMCSVSLLPSQPGQLPEPLEDHASCSKSYHDDQAKASVHAVLAGPTGLNGGSMWGSATDGEQMYVAIDKRYLRSVMHN